MAFYVGQKVVCVDDDGDFIKGFGPVKGRIYTVSGISDSCLRVHEIPMVTPGWGGGFLQRRFRPVVERKTDISIFERMLNPAKQAAETVGFLAAGWAICVGFQFAQFIGGQ